MTLYMKVTNDKYELPLAVAESKSGLADMLGLDRTAVTHGLKLKSPLYVVVEVDDDED